MSEGTSAGLTRQETLAIVERLDPHYAGLMRALHQEIEELVELPGRLARLCNLGAASALRDRGMVREFLGMAREAGATLEEMVETIFASTHFGGFSPLSDAISVFVELYGHEPFKGQTKADYPDGPRIDSYDQPAMDVGIEMYGPIRARANIDMFRGVGGRKFADAVEAYAYAGVFRRKVLPIIDRQIIYTALLACIERPGPFTWQAKAALRVGATPDQLKNAVIGQATVAGVVVVFKAMALLNPIIADWRAHPGSDNV
jgi:alkylhydroperoxidase/carboxymuconolactone decarboxylase family protein YurZ